jgi:hypothetical protein
MAAHTGTKFVFTSQQPSGVVRMKNIASFSAQSLCVLADRQHSVVETADTPLGGCLSSLGLAEDQASYSSINVVWGPLDPALVLQVCLNNLRCFTSNVLQECQGMLLLLGKQPSRGCRTAAQRLLGCRLTA